MRISVLVNAILIFYLQSFKYVKNFFLYYFNYCISIFNLHSKLVPSCSIWINFLQEDCDATTEWILIQYLQIIYTVY